MTLRFASHELALEGQRFILRLGDLRREVTLRRVSEDEVGARVVIPAHERPADLTDVEIEQAQE